MKKDKKKTIDVREAGRKGGTTTLQRRGLHYFRIIGKKGGKRTAQLYRELLREFGKRGGRPRKPILGEHMREEDPEL